MGRLGEILLILCLCLTGTVSVSAAPQIIEAEGTYIMGDNDSPKIARDAARQEAMRSAVEKAGVYVESYSKTQNMELTEDDVRTISGAVLKVTNEEDEPQLIGKTWRYVVRLTAEVDTDHIDLQAMMAKRKEIEKLQKERDELKKENEELLGKYQKASGSEKQDIGSQLENSYAVNAVFDRCVAMIQRGEQHDAIHDLSDVIRDSSVSGSPRAYAYYLRGRAYYELNSDNLALDDFDAAQHEPHDNSVYPVWRCHQYRGLIYYDRQQYEDAYTELKKAWEASDQTDDDLWQDLQRADEKAHPRTITEAPRREGGGVDWGRLIGDIIAQSIDDSRHHYVSPHDGAHHPHHWRD